MHQPGFESIEDQVFQQGTSDAPPVAAIAAVLGPVAAEIIAVNGREAGTANTARPDRSAGAEPGGGA